MSCNDVRTALTHGTGTPPELSDHLDACPACARFAARMAAARDLLRGHHGEVEPDAMFAQRVAARLPDSRAEVLGQAAFRLLPATVALLAILMWMAWSVTPETTTVVVESPTEDPLAWVLAENGTDS